MRLVWHSIFIPEDEHRSPPKLKKVPGLISEKGMLLSQNNIEQNRTARPRSLLAKKGSSHFLQGNKCDLFRIYIYIFVNFVSFPTREVAIFPPSRGTSMTCSLTSKYRTNLTKTCRWLGKSCGIWCRDPKEKSQGEKSGKELGSTYLLRLFFSRHFWKRSEVLHDQIEVSKGGDAKLSLRFPPATWRSIQKMKECMSIRILTLKVASDRCRKIQRPFIKSLLLQWW